jgi:hypothetical protein
LIAVSLVGCKTKSDDTDTVAEDDLNVETVDQVEPDDFGLPIYPGAEVSDEQGGLLRTQQEAGFEIVGWFESGDPPSEVIAWYADELDLTSETGFFVIEKEGELPATIEIVPREEGSLIKLTARENG